MTKRFQPGVDVQELESRAKWWAENWLNTKGRHHTIGCLALNATGGVEVEVDIDPVETIDDPAAVANVTEDAIATGGDKTLEQLEEATKDAEEIAQQKAQEAEQAQKELETLQQQKAAKKANKKAKRKANKIKRKKANQNKYKLLGGKP